MDICGEHGEEIAYMGRDCPACSQLEEVEKDHNREIEDLEFSHREEVDAIENSMLEEK